MIRCIVVEGYRSLRSVYVPLGRLTVVTGANGAGKSSLYRVLGLLCAAASGGVVGALAREGGLSSTLWAGPELISGAMRRGERPVQGTVRRGPVALRIGFGADELSYAVDLGLPQRSDVPSLFSRDPQVKVEAVWAGPRPRPAGLLAERRGPVVRCRGDAGWDVLPVTLSPFDTMLAEVADARAAPEVLRVRDAVRSWRFYDQIRTDPGSRVRAGSVGTRTTALAADGSDLAAALATIDEIGDGDRLAATIDAAFPGSRVEVVDRDGVFDLALHQPGLLRPLLAAELSDGTLRFLVWSAALLSPRPPELLVLNEPENSLHPDLLPPLAALIVAASRRGQVLLVSHSALFRHALRRAADADDSELADVALVKGLGETSIRDQGPFEGAAWTWPRR